MIDNGYPITTEISLLKDLVKVPQSVVKSVVNTAMNLKTSSGHGRSPVPWRKAGIRYATNEIFFDLIEEMSCIVDVNGMSVLCEINGRIHANCKLSGMPDLLLQFKEPSLIEDCYFHPCVRYSRYEQDRSVSFVPPDGEFDLMHYQVTNIPMSPIYCRSQLSFSDDGARGNVNIMLGLRHTMGKTLEDVRVDIPLPALETHNLHPSQGTIVYDAKNKLLRWNVGKIFPEKKDTNPSITGHLTLPPKTKIAKSGPSAVMLYFKLPTVALSGMKVDSVQLKTENYKPYKGVRYMTGAGRFEIRTY
jgi:AP-3 complex subunit mu